MKLKRYEATRQGRQELQTAECLVVGRLAICRETTDYSMHLLFNEDVPALLRNAGYEVQVDELDVPGKGEGFSELQYTKYEKWHGAIYLFEDFAVNVSLDDGIQLLAKEGLTANDLAHTWCEPEIDWNEPDEAVHVPLDQMGKLAIQIEQLQYDVWDLLERAPGEEMMAEERINAIQMLYEGMQQGESCSNIVDELNRLLVEEREEICADHAEQREYLGKRLDTVNQLVEQTVRVRQECATFEQEALEAQMTNDAGPSMIQG